MTNSLLFKGCLLPTVCYINYFQWLAVVWSVPRPGQKPLEVSAGRLHLWSHGGEEESQIWHEVCQPVCFEFIIGRKEMFYLTTHSTL